MIVHQCSIQVCFLQGTVQHNTCGDIRQFHDRGSNYERDIPGTRQRDERFGINTTGDGDCVAGRGDCYIRNIVLINVRCKADKKNAVVATWKTGTAVRILSIAEGWYEIEAKGIHGWVLQEYLTKD